MKIRIPSQTKLYLLLVFVVLAGFGFTFFLPAPLGFHAFIVAAGLAGLGVAINIYQTKQHGRQLVCPTGSDCNAVVTSKYAKFFGISLEYWGLGYYSLIVLAYITLIFVPQIFSPTLILAVIIFSVLAGLFSLYLLFVQAVLLRKWCIWCILSALLSLGICIFSLASAETLVNLLADFDLLLQMLRGFGLALGLGGITAAGLLFRHSLEDNVVSEKELSSLQSVFELVWIGLGFVVVGQFGLYIAHPEMLAASGVFVAQMVALAVAIIAGATLMIVYAPFLTYISFSEEKEADSFSSLRRPILLMGAITAVAWYFVFFTSFLAGISATLLLLVFLALLLLTILTVVVWDIYKVSS
ncbi:MAG: vitamin K epoxide reductase family protein [Candidatus Paceibacterota bacterium]